ncbi:MAG: pilin [Candidatus Magasanikbacteria bacterium]|nr:pilin [Candidatus Magasanikbacteria bacterium]
MKKILLITIALLIIFVPQFVFADALGSGLLNQSVGGVGLESDLNTSTANIITAILAVTGTIFLVLTVVGGVMWMTASGNEEKIGKAQKIIIGAVIGLAIILFAYTITAFVASRLGQSGDVEGTEDCSSKLGGVCTPMSSCPSGQVIGTCPPSGETQRVCCGA